MSIGLLDRINHGYREIEPVIVGLMAMNKSFMLIGRHGTGKTRLARELSRGYGQQGFVFYDATKDDLVSIAGIPDPEAIRAGRLAFVHHQRSIWDKDTIVVDEITRAGKESQNLWLEILEEHTCFGLPLSYRTLVATANPESYAAAFQLDEALLDRFYAVMPVPEMQEGVSSADVQAMAELALGGDSGVEDASIARAFVEIQQAHAALVEEGAREAVVRYVAHLVPGLLRVLQEQNGPYLSPRTYARNLPELIMAVAAWYRVEGSADALSRGAVPALRYGIATKLQIKPALLDGLHRSAAKLLRTGELAASEKLRVELGGLTTFEERVAYVRRHWGSMRKELAVDEVEKVVGQLLRGASAKGEREKLVDLRRLLDELGYTGDALRQVDGHLVGTLHKAINFAAPKLAKVVSQCPKDKTHDRALRNIKRYQGMVSDGTLLADKRPAVNALKAWLIDLWEGDVPADDETILRYFGSLELG